MKNFPSFVSLYISYRKCMVLKRQYLLNIGLHLINLRQYSFGLEPSSDRWKSEWLTHMIRFSFVSPPINFFFLQCSHAKIKLSTSKLFGYVLLVMNHESNTSHCIILGKLHFFQTAKIPPWAIPYISLVPTRPTVWLNFTNIIISAPLHSRFDHCYLSRV